MYPPTLNNFPSHIFDNRCEFEYSFAFESKLRPRESKTLQVQEHGGWQRHAKAILPPLLSLVSYCFS